MAKVFITHSSKDIEIVNFLNKCFYNSNVSPVFEELERIYKGDITTEDIRRDINDSNTVFVMLSTNVEEIPHTRDWVATEAGSFLKKDVWVFEQYSELGKLSMIIPFVKHYVIYSTGDRWVKYVNNIIKSYDDSHVLPTLAVGSGLGGLLGGAAGFFMGAVGATVIGSAARPKRPPGLEIRCEECSSVYKIHIPKDLSAFRCPVCNTALEFES